MTLVIKVILVDCILAGLAGWLNNGIGNQQ